VQRRGHPGVPEQHIERFRLFAPDAVVDLVAPPATQPEPRRYVVMLDEGIGHWPQIEAPDAVLAGP
jgi:hypothetical protein